ncbi:MAG: hypothetical protein ACJAVV_001513 [Alphaproteobacteria bacterium]|jgi:hypothetical protein
MQIALAVYHNVYHHQHLHLRPELAQAIPISPVSRSTPIIDHVAETGATNKMVIATAKATCNIRRLFG